MGTENIYGIPVLFFCLPILGSSEQLGHVASADTHIWKCRTYFVAWQIQTSQQCLKLTNYGQRLLLAWLSSPPDIGTKLLRSGQSIATPANPRPGSLSDISIGHGCSILYICSAFV